VPKQDWYRRIDADHTLPKAMKHDQQIADPGLPPHGVLTGPSKMLRLDPEASFHLRSAEVRKSL
jgi:hypothetical protein